MFKWRDLMNIKWDGPFEYPTIFWPPWAYGDYISIIDQTTSSFYTSLGFWALCLIKLQHIFTHFWGFRHYVFVDDQVVRLLGIWGWHIFANSLCYNG